MTRRLAVLLAILGILALAEVRIRESQEARRFRAGALRPLARISVEQVKAFQVGHASQVWTYVRRDGIWRFPAYFDAFAQAARVDHVLGSLLQSYCTVVSTQPGDLVHFGLTPEQRLRVILMDGTGAPLLAAWVGRGGPGPGAEEAYVQLAGADTIYHLHANPRLAWPTRPMLDPHVLPQALTRNPIVQITYERDAAYLLRALRRVETAPGFPSLPGMPPQGPTYEWLGDFAGEEKTCVSASAFAYLGFLSRLRYEALHDPRDYVPGDGRQALYLEDEQGRADTLEVGSRDAAGNVFLRNRTTGQVLTIASEKASLLFPTSQALLDSLPEPSPYFLAESIAPSPF